MRISRSSVLLSGATGGLGQAIARELAQRGAALTLTGTREAVLEPLARELDARAVPVDLGDREQLKRLVAAAGEVDILVANAGISAAGLLQSFPLEQVDRVLEVNLRAPIALAHGLLPGMLRRGSGHIVFMSSIAGKAATAGQATYCATKFGLRGISLALRAELHGTGVGVSTVFPTFIREAGMFADSGAKLPPGVGTRSPRDVACAVVEAIERNRAEVDVAPLHIRAGSMLSGFAPDMAATVTRAMGGERIVQQYVESNDEKGS